MRRMGILNLIVVSLFICSFTSVNKNVDSIEASIQICGQSPVMPQNEFVLNIPELSEKNTAGKISIENKHPAIVKDTSNGDVCDIIYYKTGKIEYCKIIESNSMEVIYKMCDYLDGPMIRVNKSELHKIRYANGREDIVSYGQKNSSSNAYLRRRAETSAVSSMVLSFVAIFLLRFSRTHFILVFILSIVGILLGIIGLRRISKSNGGLSGKGFAITGIIISCILFTLLAAILHLI